MTSKNIVKKLALVPVMVLALVGAMLLNPSTSSAEGYKQFTAFKTALGSAATLWADPLAVDNNGKTEVVYCYNKELDYPLEKGMGGTAGYMHTHFAGDANTQALKNVIFRGYPTNGANLQGSLTDAQFRGITQYAVWHFTDKLAEQAVHQIISNENKPEVVDAAMGVFKALVASEGAEAPADFAVDFYRPQDDKFQNLLGGIKSTVEAVPVSAVAVINKVSSEAAGKQLEGAKLALKNTDGSVYFEWTSGAVPQSVQVQVGHIYTLTEVAAPKGYALAKDIKFRVTAAGVIEVEKDSVWSVSSDSSITLVNTPAAAPEPTPSAEPTVVPTPTPAPSTPSAEPTVVPTPTPAPSTPSAEPTVVPTPTPAPSTPSVHPTSNPVATTAPKVVEEVRKGATNASLAKTGSATALLLGLALLSAVAGLIVTGARRLKG